MGVINVISFSIAILASISVVTCDSAAELGNSNFETTIKESELVLVNFYAKWCKFSRMLEPVFDEAAKLVHTKYEGSKIKLGKVDCEREADVARRYGINKYPTIKIFVNGKMHKREYRGSRTKEAIAEYIAKQVESPVKEIKDLDDIQDMLDKNKHNIIGYFPDNESPEYKNFDKVAGMLREDCGWFTAFGSVSESQRPGGGFQIIYKPPNTEHGEKLFSNSLKSHELFYSWAQDKCIPLVRTITFENAEELTEEGIPFLILFHHPDDKESAKKFSEVVAKSLIREKVAGVRVKDSITFLTADGVQFAHPLHHMGKSARDLPVLAIDSFKHMYVFPDKERMFDPEALLQFITDLHSGKLHREFHHGPDQQAPARPPQEAPKPAGKVDPDRKEEKKEPVVQQEPVTDPPESQFAKLAPSDLRYSFKYKDEL